MLATVGRIDIHQYVFSKRIVKVWTALPAEPQHFTSLISLKRFIKCWPYMLPRWFLTLHSFVVLDFWQCYGLPGQLYKSALCNVIPFSACGFGVLFSATYFFAQNV